MIELRHVSKTFQTKHDHVHAVKDVSLHIEKGEIFGVIGYSGAGKSTLIRCINLLERPSEGDILVDGHNMLELSDKDLRKMRKKIGMIFQHFNLMRSRTVFQNVAFPLKNSGLTKDEIQKKVSELLSLVELADKKDAYPSQLSGGQKQRVAIARALANDPSVLLCDEATSALDPQTTQSILKLLKELNQRLHITIVLITHEMAVIKEICDRVAVMEHGVVVESGSILDIFAHPKADATKKFIQSTSAISKIYEMVENNHVFTQVSKGQWLIHLKYGAGNTKEAMLSHICANIGVEISIIYGNVEVIHDTPFGDMVVILDASDEKKQAALDYLEKSGVEVEVIRYDCVVKQLDAECR
ncbi:MAG: methionine ABC transporter ATP-binding protein [Erysipelotrichaceae bacterium]|nr:methionine ABC transporter ATP-binding protein [Erysipelotrichaceae bacterium]